MEERTLVLETAGQNYLAVAEGAMHHMMIQAAVMLGVEWAQVPCLAALVKWQALELGRLLGLQRFPERLGTRGAGQWPKSCSQSFPTSPVHLCPMRRGIGV